MKDAFVVILAGGSQHIVGVGDEFEINRIDGKVGETITFDEVYLFQDDKDTIVGTPVTGHTVTAEIVSHSRAPKIDVRIYKAKSRYRRKRGHRQERTSMKIVKISSLKQSTKKPAKPA